MASRRWEQGRAVLFVAGGRKFFFFTYRSPPSTLDRLTQSRASGLAPTRKKEVFRAVYAAHAAGLQRRRSAKSETSCAALHTDSCACSVARCFLFLFLSAIFYAHTLFVRRFRSASSAASATIDYSSGSCDHERSPASCTTVPCVSAAAATTACIERATLRASSLPSACPCVATAAHTFFGVDDFALIASTARRLTLWSAADTLGATSGTADSPFSFFGTVTAAITTAAHCACRTVYGDCIGFRIICDTVFRFGLGVSFVGVTRPPQWCWIQSCCQRA